MSARRPGTYRTRLAITTPTETNTNGNVTATFAAFASRWGEVISTPGAEFTESAALHARRMYEVRMPYLAGLLPKMRITCLIGGVSRTLEVSNTPTTDDATHYRETVCTCAETDGT